MSRKRRRDNSERHFDVGIVYDSDLFKEFNKLPLLENRGEMVHTLIESYDLLRNMKLMKNVRATDEELQTFHSSDFVEYLKSINNLYTPDDTIDLDFGLGYDCPPLDGIYDYICAVAGGSLTAARALMSGDVDIAINWNGGWHHAHRDQVSGFCYVNDVVIAILELKQTFNKILYIDLDVHHGDGVEECFVFSRAVVTWSIHKFEPGYFPGTGESKPVEGSDVKSYTINMPLKEGISDSRYTQIFDRVLEMLLPRFAAEAIVVQCGADSLSGDPLGGFSLSSKALAHCLNRIVDLRKPTLVLGGGGYNKVNTARCWTYLTSVIVGVELEEDIPEHEFFTEYGPAYELSVDVGNRKDENSEESINILLETIKSNLERISD